MPFFLFSPNHLTKELYSLSHFAVSVTCVRKFVIGELSGISDKFAADLSKPLSVYFITTVSSKPMLLGIIRIMQGLCFN